MLQFQHYLTAKERLLLVYFLIRNYSLQQKKSLLTPIASIAIEHHICVMNRQWKKHRSNSYYVVVYEYKICHICSASARDLPCRRMWEKEAHGSGERRAMAGLVRIAAIPSEQWEMGDGEWGNGIWWMGSGMDGADRVLVMVCMGWAWWENDGGVVVTMAVEEGGGIPP